MSRAGPHSVIVALIVAFACVVVVDVGLQLRRGTRTGQTMGRQVFGLTLRSTGRTATPTWRLALREILRWPAGVLILVLGSNSPFVVHDRMLGTAVVAVLPHQAAHAGLGS